MEKIQQIINDTIKEKLKGSSYQLETPIRLSRNVSGGDFGKWNHKDNWYYMAPAVQVYENGGNNNSELYKWF